MRLKKPAFKRGSHPKLIFPTILEFFSDVWTRTQRARRADYSLGLPEDFGRAVARRIRAPVSLRRVPESSGRVSAFQNRRRRKEPRDRARTAFPPDLIRTAGFTAGSVKSGCRLYRAMIVAMAIMRAMQMSANHVVHVSFVWYGVMPALGTVFMRFFVTRAFVFGRTAFL